MADVKPLGGVWCDDDRLSVRYMPHGNRIVINWVDAAILTGVEVPDMRAAIRNRINRAKAQTRRQSQDVNMSITRKPIQRAEPSRRMTLELIAEAKKEAREWHEQRQSNGLGRQLA